MKNCVLKCHHVCQRKFSGVGARRQTGAPSKSGWNLSTMMSDFALFPHCSTIRSGSRQWSSTAPITAMSNSPSAAGKL